MVSIDTDTGLALGVDYRPSPNHDERDPGSVPQVLILHCISLPPGRYGGGEIARFFENELRPDEHPYFADIAHLQVSSHFLIDRQGEIIQFVPCHLRAWHAGESSCLQRPKVNDFSIGIELEGLDTDPTGFTPEQYSTLSDLIDGLVHAYPSLHHDRIFAHSDIAPGRKPDPGPFFDWQQVYTDHEKR